LTEPATISPPETDKRGHKSRERRCIVSGQTGSADDKIRFVLSPDDVVTPDIAGKLPGRGVWVSSDKESLTQAVKTAAFARGFKRKVSVPDDLIEMTESLLATRFLGLLAMARKSGKISLGFDQVQSAARSDLLGLRIEARDGSQDGRGKIRVLAKAMAHELEKPAPIVVGCFGAAELGKALGRDNVVHAAIPKGGLARSMVLAAKRLSGFRELIPAEWPDRTHE